MRSIHDVKALGSNPGIYRHIGICGAGNEAVLNTVHKISVSDPDPHGSALKLTPWIRIRIRIGDVDSGSGSRIYKITKKFRNIEYFLQDFLTCFKGLRQVYILYQFFCIINLMKKKILENEKIFSKLLIYLCL